MISNRMQFGSVQLLLRIYKIPSSNEKYLTEGEKIFSSDKTIWWVSHFLKRLKLNTLLRTGLWLLIRQSRTSPSSISGYVDLLATLLHLLGSPGPCWYEVQALAWKIFSWLLKHLNSSLSISSLRIFSRTTRKTSSTVYSHATRLTENCQTYIYSHATPVWPRWTKPALPKALFTHPKICNQHFQGGFQISFSWIVINQMADGAHHWLIMK